MNATIGKPFLLSSYTLPKQLQKSTDASSVYVTHNRTTNNSDGYVTVAAQGDGVHVLDLSSLHPVVSHTLGPSTTFSCPVVSRNTVENGARICTTYSAIDSSSDVPAEESGRTVWTWKDNLSASLDMASQRKKSTVISHAVSKIYVPDELDSKVLLMSSDGRLTVMDAESSALKTHNSPGGDGVALIECFVFSRSACPFLPTRTTPPQCAIIILFLQVVKTTRAQILAVSDDELVELGNTELKVPPDQISGISCSTSGYLSILIRDGVLRSFLLDSTSGDSIDATTLPESIHLASLSFTTCPQNRRSLDEISMLSLGSSHVLLAGITTSSTPEIALLLWDLQYSVLLASNTLPIPSSLSYSKDHSVRLSLVAANTSQVLLLLCPVTSSTGVKSRTHSAPPSRSSVLVLPLTVPPVSTVANAMGRAADGQRWLVNDTSSLNSSSVELDPPRENLLKIMRKSMENNRIAASNAAFFEWEKSESEAIDLGVNSDRGKPLTMDYAFLKQLLDVVLQPSKPANSPYSPEVLHFLLRGGLISANMIEGGLLAALRLRNDWKALELALGHVLDIPENDIMSALKFVVTHHRNSGSSNEDTMQVDSDRVIPALPSFLSSCVRYATSPAALRLAIHEHLPEGEDIVCVLEVIEEWLSKLVSSGDALSPTKKASMSTDDSKAPPPLTKVLSFLQALLDASLLRLLQYWPSHGLLRKILSGIELEVDSIEQMRKLLGPLEPFAKVTKEASEGKRGERQVGRKTKKRMQAQSALAVGMYRLEELVL